MSDLVNLLQQEQAELNTLLGQACQMNIEAQKLRNTQQIHQQRRSQSIGNNNNPAGFLNYQPANLEAPNRFESISVISANTRQSNTPLQAATPLTPAGIFPQLDPLPMPMMNNQVTNIEEESSSFGIEFAGKVPPMDSELAKMIVAQIR